MTEFDWRLPMLGRFNDWEIINRLEDRTPASVVSTGTISVSVIDSSGNAHTAVGYYDYDSASAGWQNMVGNGLTWCDNLEGAADQHVTDCQASLDSADSTSICVTCAPEGTPAAAVNILTSGYLMGDDCYYLAQGFEGATSQTSQPRVDGNDLNFRTFNGPYRSTATDSATNATDALAHAKAMVARNKDIAARLKEIAGNVSDADSVPVLGTLAYWYYQGELHALEVECKDNFAKLADLHARFPNTVK